MISLGIIFRQKKKTLVGLGDGDFYHGKLNRNKQPHLKQEILQSNTICSAIIFKRLCDGNDTAFNWAELTPFFY